MSTLAHGLNVAIAGKPLDEVAFSHPWTARAFAIMIAGSQAGHFALTDFQSALIIKIKASEEQEIPIITEEDYYTCWLEALTDLFHNTTEMTITALSEMQEKVCTRLEDLEHSHDHDHDRANDAQPIAAHKPAFTEGGTCK